MSKKILQPDGTYCYSGPTCKKHGTQNQIQQLSTKINNLFEKEPNWRATTPTAYQHIAKKYYEEELEIAQHTLEETGLKHKLTLPDWNETALQNGLYELQLNQNSSLLINPPNSWGIKSRRRIIVWWIEKGKPIAMLNFLISPDKKSQKDWGEAVVSSIEVHKNEQGKGYALKIIRTVENHLINQKLHSGGHYTPEGEKALRNKLPYTKVALEEQKQHEINPTFNPGIGVRFSSMNFVENWDSFWEK